MLEFTVQPGDKEKAGCQLQNPRGRDLSNFDAMAFDAYNPQKFPITLWCALVSRSDDADIWYEQMRTITVPAESWATNLQINLTRDYWKGFNNDQPTGINIRPQLNPVRNLFFLLGKNSQPYKVYLDGIRFEKDTPAPSE
jgi:hypothetical protein